MDYEKVIEKELAGEAHSDAFKVGVLWQLKWLRGERLSAATPYKHGTLELDAYRYGMERGQEIHEKLLLETRTC